MNDPQPLTKEEREILHHTLHRAAGGLYCGGSKEMEALLARGLMEPAGFKSFVPDPYFRITNEGIAALSRERSRTPKRNAHPHQS